MRSGDRRDRRWSTPALLRRLARVERRADIRILEALCRLQGQTVWLVGGALRDFLSNRPVTEIDLVLPADPLPFARELEGLGFGTAVALSDLSPRVARVAGRREVDIAELTGGSIEADLGRRDFTVNAMAWDLGSRRFIDPFGGVLDLSRRRLRMISSRNLREDPLRVLRAARLVATHGLSPDRALTLAARREAGELASVAPERVRTEIVKLLESSRVLEALRWLGRVGASKYVFGAPAHGRPLGTRAFPARLDDVAVRRLEPESRRRIRLSLIGARLGLTPAAAARWLAGRRFSRQEAGAVGTLLELAERARKIRDPRDAWAWLRDSGERRSETVLLLRLLLPPGSDLSRRLGALRPRRTVPLTGRDIMEWLQIPSGPRVGFLLREAEIESLRGRIRSRREARRWLVQTWSGGREGSPGRPTRPPHRL
jgi:tRNA nucleotidyltransferase/poly(A) polymerase